MAIQVGGTTVINNSRQLQNISGLDATSQGNFPFLQDITTSTTSYTPTGTNQTVDDKESISTLNQASTTISKTTSTSMTKVVINSTLPTFSNTDVLTISSAATVSRRNDRRICRRVVQSLGGNKRQSFVFSFTKRFVFHTGKHFYKSNEHCSRI